MKQCSLSYECHNTSSQDHPVSLEKFCLQDHNPFWYPISEVDIELSQAKYVAKPMEGRMRDNIFSLINISAYLKNVQNNSYPKQTKYLWHLCRRHMEWGDTTFYCSLYYHSWNSKWKTPVSFSRRFVDWDKSLPKMNFWDRFRFTCEAKKSVY